MPGLPQSVMHHPQPHDIVDDPISIAGIVTAFEAAFAVRARDAHGTVIVEQNVHGGGTGVWANYLISLPLGKVPATPNGTVETFEFSAKDGSEINKVTVPIIFGTALLPGYFGFAQYTVVAGDTLSKIARHWFNNDPNKWHIIYEANRQQIADPNVVHVGQTLRIPQSNLP